MAYVYRKPTGGLELASRTSKFLNKKLFPVLKGWPNFENYYLKPRMQDELSVIIQEALEANQLWPKDWRERIKKFRHVAGRFDYFLILLDHAHEREYIDDNLAGEWQAEIDILIGMTHGLVGDAMTRGHKWMRQHPKGGTAAGEEIENEAEGETDEGPEESLLSDPEMAPKVKPNGLSKMGRLLKEKIG